MTFSDFIRRDDEAKEAVYMKVMDKVQREQLRVLALAATPGEWKWVDDDYSYGWLRSGAQDVLSYAGCGTHECAVSGENKAYIAAANPTTLLALLDRVDELEGDAEPVAWMHENPLRADAISDYIKSLLVDGESSPGGIHRPMDEGNKYSIPLYRRPPTTKPTHDSILNWAVDQWHGQVARRPLINVHRRTLDSVWRQVIKKLGGDDVLLCGPCHDDLLNERGEPAAPGAGGGE